MTYRAGVGPSLALAMGVDGPSYPSLRCDVVGCGYTIEVKPTRGGMPAWLRDGKAPKGWRACANRSHTCPECTKALKI